MLPVVVFMWVVGWSLYWIGLKKEVPKRGNVPAQKELTFNVRMPEAKCVNQQAHDQA
jgi:hypothetical protein